ncbi:hypothetical protein EJ08DRAFT_61992 [Tothia fuscella]|uniref:Autophagy-related protein 17 n=1 Tax=Tothia fuscella TaxID=1048955 RepID=A0A9P4NYY1_9PEZI|nr:hypothetical protein EJ08DRAFT_61992 [Tothia fuscella]
MANSPPASPTSSQGSFTEPDLSQLVEYLLASKRSLSSISLVWRAREIVETGRGVLEANAALCAKNTFVRQQVDRQVAALEAIRHGASIVDEEGHDEFQLTVQSLDKASDRLKRTLDSLRTTPVEASFRPSTEPPKTLFDFVDDASINELENSVKTSMDRFETARSMLVDTCEDFEKDLQRLHESLQEPPEEDDGVIGRVRTADGISPVPGLFYALENHATEAATHLEGLVKHYDLCVTALKHTEGGGEAISRATDDEQDPQASALAGLGVDLGKLDSAPSQPMSEEERTNMLAVLVKDAVEVEDVVSEIKDRIAEMEDQLLEISAFIQTLSDKSTSLRNALVILKQLTLDIPHYIAACSDFQAAWEEEKAVLSGKVDELEELRSFCSSFGDAYDDLLLEVHRRKVVRQEMEKVISNAMTQVEKLYQADFEAREVFRSAQGEYIPADLWAGLVNAPARYQVTQEEADVDEIPQIKKSVFEKASQRQKDRTKPFKRPA